jgi:hypothetical protein
MHTRAYSRKKELQSKKVEKRTQPYINTTYKGTTNTINQREKQQSNNSHDGRMSMDTKHCTPERLSFE